MQLALPISKRLLGTASMNILKYHTEFCTNREILEMNQLVDELPIFETMFPNIVCIDDDPDVSRTLKIRLSEYKVNVHCAYFGMQGLWETIKEKPQLIITDINMPQGSGDHIVACLKNNADTKDIPIIVYSGQKDTAIKRQILNLGVNRYLTKPVELHVFKNEIEAFIDLELREQYD